MVVQEQPVNSADWWDGMAAAHDTPWAAAGWSEHGQLARFTAVLRYADPRPGQSLLDFGCGTGFLSEFLDSEVDYLGVDWSEGMLARARVEHPGRSFTAVLPMPTRRFDYAVAVGTFNLPGSDAAASVRRLAQLARVVVVSLYTGHDRRCVRYDVQDAADMAAVAGRRRWTADFSHLDNDMLLVLK